MEIKAEEMEAGYDMLIEGHKSGECTLKRDNLKCSNRKQTGHLAKACQSKPDSGLQQA